MITATYLVCVAFGHVSWPLWGALIAFLADLTIARELSPVLIWKSHKDD